MEAGESFGVCLLINLSKDAEGRTWHGCIVGAPWVHVSTVWKAGCTTRGSVLGFVFLKQNGRPIRWAVCGVLCPTGCYGWLVSFLEGAKLHLLGELSFYQQERKTALLVRNLTFSQSRKQQGVDECRGKTCPHCYASGLNYTCYRFIILVDSSCDFKYSYNWQGSFVNLEDFSISRWCGL